MNAPHTSGLPCGPRHGIAASAIPALVVVVNRPHRRVVHERAPQIADFAVRCEETSQESRHDVPHFRPARRISGISVDMHEAHVGFHAGSAAKSTNSTRVLLAVAGIHRQGSAFAETSASGLSSRPAKGCDRDGCSIECQSWHKQRHRSQDLQQDREIAEPLADADGVKFGNDRRSSEKPVCSGRQKCQRGQGLQCPQTDVQAGPYVWRRMLPASSTD